MRNKYSFQKRFFAPVSMRVWSSIGELIVLGQWPCDFARLGLRMPPAASYRLVPSLPRRELLVQHFQQISAQQAPGRAPQAKVVSDELVQHKVKYGRKGGAQADEQGAPQSGVVQFCAPHLIRALRATVGCKSKDDLRGHVDRALAFAMPARTEEMSEEMKKAHFEVPSRWTLLRAQIRLDVASVLMQRRTHREPCQSLSRYLAYDASPKQGLEVYAVKEMVLRDGDYAAATWRHLPLSSLGHRHAGAADKTVGVIHAMFLVSGPRSEDMRRWASQVRWCLTDSGAEMLAADMPDFIDAFLDHRLGEAPPQLPADPSAVAPCGFLFPVAMRGPGWNHLWDLVLKHVCMKHIPWFSGWMQQARAMCTFLRNTGLRERLAKAGEDKGVEADILQTLKQFSASFAKWRWGSLTVVCRAICNAEEAVIRSWDEKAFKLKDRSIAVSVAGSVGDPSFWARAACLHRWSGDLEAVRTWGQGCSCHEEACRAAAAKKQTFKCPQNRKSCRGAELSAKLSRTWALWSATAADIANEEFVDADLGMQMCIAYRMSIAEGMLRFGWVEELPWLLWKCRCPEAAKRVRSLFVQLSESSQAGASAAAGFKHRVAQRFFGPDGLLKVAMDKHIDHQEMSELLDLELAAYEHCPLDETVAEASHRDVNRCALNASPSQLAFWSSSQRLVQNLADFDSYKNASKEEEFYECMYNRKAIMQFDSRWESKLRGCRVGGEVVKRIYRYGVWNQADWSEYK